MVGSFRTPQNCSIILTNYERKENCKFKNKDCKYDNFCYNVIKKL